MDDQLPLLSRNVPGKVAEPALPERILQVGEGNFIRAFADWLVQQLVHQGLFTGSIVLTPARRQGKSKVEGLGRQEGRFTVWFRGCQDNETVDRTDIVSVISRIVNPFEDWATFLACAEQAPIEIVLSNTTEAGLLYEPDGSRGTSPSDNFPARLTAYLFRRFQAFAGDPGAGMIMVPLELVPANGPVLRAAVLQHAQDWDLGSPFTHWVLHHNVFLETLVDRIVTGFPAEAFDKWVAMGYRDDFLTAAEPFLLWAIEDHPRIRQALPWDRMAVNVHFTADVDRYRRQKLRILNGTHTFLAPLGLLLGLKTVQSVMEHPDLSRLAAKVVYELVIPYGFGDEAQDELVRYAESIFERFRNPFLEHALEAITLNTFQKFQVRLWPVIQQYYAVHRIIPSMMAFDFAAQLALYHPSIQVLASEDGSRSPRPPWLEKLWNDDGDSVQGILTGIKSAGMGDNESAALSDFATLVAHYLERILHGETLALIHHFLAN